MASSRLRNVVQEGGHLLDAGPPRESVAPLVRELDVQEVVGPPAPVELLERRSDRRRIVRRGDDTRAGLADQLGRGAVRRDGRQDRAADGDVLEDLAREDALPRPSASGMRSKSASESRCSARDAARGA